MTQHQRRAPIGCAIFGLLLPHSQSPQFAAALLAPAPTAPRFSGPPGAMDGERSLFWLLLLVLTPPEIWGIPDPAIPAQHVITQLEFYQKSLDPAVADSDQYLFDFDGDEIFHVEKEETVWRLPEFQEFASFEAQGALQNIAIDKQNLEYSMKASNNSRIPSQPPEVLVFPKQAVQPDEPNVLICSVRELWPPALGLRWLRNGQRLEGAGLRSPFYADRENSFRTFAYLPFIPRPGEYYDCEVEHEGLPEPARTHWEAQLPVPVSEAAEVVLCALGLALGIAGIAAGTALIGRAMRLARARGRL